MKKQYMQPTMIVVKMQQKSQILAGSNYGMNKELSESEADEAW